MSEPRNHLSFKLTGADLADLAVIAAHLATIAFDGAGEPTRADALRWALRQAVRHIRPAKKKT